MGDTLTEEQRSYCMSQIKRKDTKPEIKLRKIIWNLGEKGYRVDAKLPGKPDIVFTKNKLAIFIDGCFWHKCPKCYVVPKSNKEYWIPKIDRNIQRDKEVNKKLRDEGFKVIRLWEHEIKKNPSRCAELIIKENRRKKK